MKPLSDVLYAPVDIVAEVMDRPADQVIYMLASVVALLSCFTLKGMEGRSATTRKLFSLLTGLFIHYYVFGLSGLASIVTNILSYLAIVILPKD